MPQILKNILLSYCWTWPFTDGYGLQETNFHNIDDDERKKISLYGYIYLANLSLYNYFLKLYFIKILQKMKKQNVDKNIGKGEVQGKREKEN